MRTTLILATLVAILVAVFAAIDANAQQQGTRPTSGGPVAVIDVKYIFDHHGRFTQGMERMKADLEAADQSVKKERSRLQGMVEQLKTFKAGTPEYKKLEEDFTQQSANLQARVNLKKKDFAERQSKLHYETYREVNDAVKYYADRHGYNLVLQFSGDPVDPNNPQSVMGAIMGTVVYQRGVDITPDVLGELNRNGAAAQRPRTGTQQK